MTLLCASGQNPMWMFGLPLDVASLTATLLGILVLVASHRRRGRGPGPKRLLIRRGAPFALAAFAATASYAYLEYYLAGSPRIIDATTYLYQARSLSEGAFSSLIFEPTASFRGRFLVSVHDDPRRLAGIFPPAYPALLALGVKLGSYKLVGPLLSATLVLLTFNLTRLLTGRRRDALVAASLSALCAVLRYHTADTMSHGLSCVLTLSALYFQVKCARLNFSRIWALLLGLALGFLLATRQLTGLAVGAACWVGLLGSSKGRLRPALQAFPLFLLGLMPGLALLIAQNLAVTGDPFLPPQLRYYALSDGPPGCFGIGLGKGCSYEHSDVVKEQGGQGLTLFWALRNTLHRFHWHSLDVANFEPLFLLAVFMAIKVRSRKRYLGLLSTLVIIPLSYSLFYFNGSYPGGGARFFSEMIPLWHVLLGVGLSSLRRVPLGLSLCLFGFAFHAARSHETLAGPSFGSPVVSAVELENMLSSEKEDVFLHGAKPLVLISSAHQFNATSGASQRFHVARRTRDSRESLLAERLSSGRVFSLLVESKGARLVPTPVNTSPVLSFEAEFEYPPLSSEDVWVSPMHHPAACVSNGRALALHRTGERPKLSLEGAAPPGVYEAELHLVMAGRCVTRPLGRLSFPQMLTLDETVLAGASHIDRLVLTPTHLRENETLQ